MARVLDGGWCGGEVPQPGGRQADGRCYRALQPPRTSRPLLGSYLPLLKNAFFGSGIAFPGCIVAAGRVFKRGDREETEVWRSISS